MFGIGMTELVVILIFALIFIGPKKLPEMAKSLGKGFAEFRKATQDLKDSIDPDNEIGQAKGAFQDMQNDLKTQVTDAVDFTSSPDDWKQTYTQEQHEKPEDDKKAGEDE